MGACAGDDPNCGAKNLAGPEGIEISSESRVPGRIELSDFEKLVQQLVCGANYTKV